MLVVISFVGCARNNIEERYGPDGYYRSDRSSSPIRVWGSNQERSNLGRVEYRYYNSPSPAGGIYGYQGNTAVPIQPQPQIQPQGAYSGTWNFPPPQLQQNQGQPQQQFQAQPQQQQRVQQQIQARPQAQQPQINVNLNGLNCSCCGKQVQPQVQNHQLIQQGPQPQVKQPVGPLQQKQGQPPVQQKGQLQKKTPNASVSPKCPSCSKK